MSTRSRIRIFFSLITLAIGLALPAHAGPDPRPGEPHHRPPHATLPIPDSARAVDLVIALDTSNSMDGLIDGARQKLWDVVNLLAQATPRPVLRVGLVSYGNDGYERKSGWVRKESDLTTDLDALYGKLFALGTNGGTEYVARAAEVAIKNMQWTVDDKALRLLFIAGNEPADQDPQLDIDQIMSAARRRKILVNAIYCGNARASDATSWRQVAQAGGGKFAAIDQNRTVAVATPMDRKLEELSRRLSSTYVGFGRAGGDKAKNQKEQDDNAMKQGVAIAASRAVAKAGKLYNADDWDLIDARDNKKKDVAAMPVEELPQEMRAMTPAQRQTFLDGKAREREAIKKEIAALSAERERYIQAEQRRRAKDDAPKALDDALGETIRSAARSAGFSL